MACNAIEIEGLGKKYRIKHASAERYQTIRSAIAQRMPWSQRSRPTESEEDFWALRDLTCSFSEGSCIGVIGRNGSGKSTLLKLISRITAPTTGRITVYGRVGSLLEVGTGFHPELTGRENIFLNGAILGMSRDEVRRKFDEIVAFADVENFLDTPVKRYSSGMYVRLAFAVAAHLETEILVVDEVLAVGDAAFQKKCLGKMGDVAKKQGRTVLFVSHNMAAVRALCDTGLVLSGGNMVYSGEVNVAIDRYLHENQAVQTAGSLADRTDRHGSGKARFISLSVYDDAGQPTNTIKIGDSFTVELTIEGAVKNARLGLKFGNALIPELLRGHTWESYPDTVDLAQRTRVRCRFDSFPLLQGTYGIHCVLAEGRDLVDEIQDAAELSVVAWDIFATGRPPKDNNAVAFCRHTWDFSDIT